MGQPAPRDQDAEHTERAGHQGPADGGRQLDLEGQERHRAGVDVERVGADGTDRDREQGQVGHEAGQQVGEGRGGVLEEGAGAGGDGCRTSQLEQHARDEDAKTGEGEDPGPAGAR